MPTIDHGWWSMEQTRLTMQPPFWNKSRWQFHRWKVSLHLHTKPETPFHKWKYGICINYESDAARYCWFPIVSVRRSTYLELSKRQTKKTNSPRLAACFRDTSAHAQVICDCEWGRTVPIQIVGNFMLSVSRDRFDYCRFTCACSDVMSLRSINVYMATLWASDR